jgi:protein-S-isoprenylcysteine O-methyltransferase Ste14
MAMVVIPIVIIYLTRSIQFDWPPPGPEDLMPLLTGIALIGIGLLMAIRTVSLFTKFGKGTPAPWDPPQKLVVRGIYRHVRNPMISSVIGILIGEVLLTGSQPLLYWSLFFLLINLIYIPAFEEPGLSRRFGEDYDLYKENVPRWIPRIDPWNSLSDDE